MFFLKKYSHIISFLLIGVILGVGGTLLVQYIKGPKQVVNVTGQGVVEAQADQATITITVQNTSWSQQQAEKDNKQETQDLKDALMKLGIPESRITVSNYASMPMIPDQTIPAPIIDKNTAPVQLPLVGGINNFSASTNLTIVLDTLKGVDNIFTTVNLSPHAKITSTNYSLKSTTPYEAQAREKALQDARNQAESIAKINNLHVGKLLFVNNNSNPVPLYKEGMGGTAGQPSSPSGITYGEKTIEISASFNAQYELY
jgi:uncharacterized protein YggE